jgi:hypothetical protein
MKHYNFSQNYDVYVTNYTCNATSDNPMGIRFVTQIGGDC